MFKLIFIDAQILGSKNEAFRILFILTIIGLIDTVGVFSFLYPLLKLLANPELFIEIIQDNNLRIFLEVLNVKDYEQLALLFASCIAILFILSGILRIYGEFKINAFLESRRLHLSYSLLRSYIEQDYQNLMIRNSSELSKNVLIEIDYVVTYVIKSIFTIFSSIFIILVLTLSLVFIDFELTSILLSSFALLSILMYLLFKKRLKKLGDNLVQDNNARYKLVSEIFSSIQLIKLFSKENYFSSLYFKSLKRLTDAQAKSQTLNNLAPIILDTIIFLVVILIVVLIGVSTSFSNTALSDNYYPVFGLYIYSALKIKPSFQKMISAGGNLEYGRSALNNIARELYMVRINHHKEYNIDKFNFRKVQFKNVSFSYRNNKERFVVKDLSVEIAKGEKVGILGLSGSGKSTFINLISGLLEPVEGSISINGELLSKKNLVKWMNSIGYVPQNIFLSDATVYENIALGVDVEEIDIKHVQNCAKLSRIHDFIVNHLPGGYNTLLGERGNNISGGQAQRVAIARSLYRNPELLIFDEATSSLDDSTEIEIMKEIYSLPQKVTTIIVTHKPSLLWGCNSIYRMNNSNLERVNITL